MIKNKKIKWLFGIALSVLAITFLLVFLPQINSQKENVSKELPTKTTISKEEKKVEPSKPKETYHLSEAEKEQLRQRFTSLKEINQEVIAYIYAPGTQLDEPVLHTGDNHKYLEQTITGEYSPYMGAVFMDMDNHPNFQDRLTWLFGHARGNTVPDHRMFNDVNFYDDQTYFNEHPYLVIETPERYYYYEAAFMIIVPETTAFYRTSFENDQVFLEQLREVQKEAIVKNEAIEINASDRYLVLSTCREEDETIRSNLYLRQIPDTELPEFLAKNKEKLTYVPTR
ncbi:class B sortase, LPKTxAVK-specific [Streptococcus sp. CSL10205-OR2]|uniref:class B sortase, LPKTxAVK-specific n=1 Tax=Streptococcus sp. CSL10205-OR2 TaxID=2980558 RepID=UPI0021D84490|nr:class B sortase, LPKTxAVK-specific [Streptococcus sp. CSL10205-OR2]MCU9533041.1 class B sortase, LPKTxAVK-specific [Streptococcus sp. CSL10205-OR2]